MIRGPRALAAPGVLALGVALSLACEAEPGPGSPSAPPEVRLYATELISFQPGPGAGFGADAMPGVVLGPPDGRGEAAGSLDVVALGDGGEIVVGFGDRRVVDRPGPDLIVFENAFHIGGSELAFAEPGEVAVSLDGEVWHSFPCDPKGDGAGSYPGCAGWHPVRPFDPALDPLDPALTGGDPFDLADLGIPEIRYVRIRDLSFGGFPPKKGFDLDAVGAIHVRR